MSLLTGIAIDKKLINSVKDAVFTYLPDYKPFASAEKLSITVEDYLTMRSGIDYNKDSREEEILAQVPDDLKVHFKPTIKNNAWHPVYIQKL